MCSDAPPVSRAREQQPDYSAAEQSGSLINFKNTFNHGPGRLRPEHHQRKVFGGARISKKYLPEGVSATCDPLKSIMTMSQVSSRPDPQRRSGSRVWTSSFERSHCHDAHKDHHCLTWLLRQLHVWEKHNSYIQKDRNCRATHCVTWRHSENWNWELLNNRC